MIVVLQAIDAVVYEQHGKHNCFVVREQAFCGNGIVETDEQCDCGYAEDCNDQLVVCMRSSMCRRNTLQ